MDKNAYNQLDDFVAHEIVARYYSLKSKLLEKYSVTTIKYKNFKSKHFEYGSESHTLQDVRYKTKLRLLKELLND